MNKKIVNKAVDWFEGLIYASIFFTFVLFVFGTRGWLW